MTLSLGNEYTLSTEPVLNSTSNETASQVCNNLSENTTDAPLSKVKYCKLEKPKNITQSLLNINSLRKKFTSIQELIKFISDIFLVRTSGSK